MRLMNVHTKKLKEFFDQDIPKYVILSHTWGKEEVTFKDLDDPDRTKMLGWTKIYKLCQKARERLVDWVWVDTCCIDKRSSSELSEAINSMFKWYQKADICFAHLEDVPKDEDYYQDDSSFRRSRWFTRGWTLQELLAPDDVLFYDTRWEYITNRRKIPDLLSQITGIRHDIMSSPLIHLPQASIAERLSWASNRETSRTEDKAYSMLGICEINIPLLYGEGDGAFIRLQEEIVRSSYDHTIFSWGIRGPWTGVTNPDTGLFNVSLNPDGQRVLANTSSAFRGFNPLIKTDSHGVHYMVTHSGLHVELRVAILEKSFWNCALAIFNSIYYPGEKSGFYFMAMPVASLQGWSGEQSPSGAKFAHKIFGNSPFFIPGSLLRRAIPMSLYISDSAPVLNQSRTYIKTYLTSWDWDGPINLDFDLLYELGYTLWDYYPPMIESEGEKSLVLLRHKDLTLLRFHSPNRKGSILVMISPTDRTKSYWAVGTYTTDESSAWEFLLRPDFRRFDFHSLLCDSSLDWSTVIPIPGENAATPTVISLRIADRSLGAVSD
ncbi:hypothetical protein AAE478_002651 [Parahypoxylon ruwenzoriense]